MMFLLSLSITSGHSLQSCLDVKAERSEILCLECIELSTFSCLTPGQIMGCVGSKKDQDAGGKALGGDDSASRTQTAHYVKDPTTGSKTVSHKDRVLPCSEMLEPK